MWHAGSNKLVRFGFQIVGPETIKIERYLYGAGKKLQFLFKRDEATRKFALLEQWPPGLSGRAVSGASRIADYLGLGRVLSIGKPRPHAPRGQ